MAIANPTKPALEIATTGETPSSASAARMAMAKIADGHHVPEHPGHRIGPLALAGVGLAVVAQPVEPHAPTPLRPAAPDAPPGRSDVRIVAGPPRPLERDGEEDERFGERTQTRRPWRSPWQPVAGDHNVSVDIVT